MMITVPMITINYIIKYLNIKYPNINDRISDRISDDFNAKIVFYNIFLSQI